MAASLVLTAIASCAAAQSPSPSSPPRPDDAMSFFDVMAISVFLAVFFPIFVVLLAFTCLRVFRPPDEPTVPETSTSEWSHHHRDGLDAEEIAALPLVSYRRVKQHRIDPLECAVCLLEFDDDDELRLLEACPHAFHAECIGIWLEKNVTCPLCRASVLDALPMPPQQPASSSPPPSETESAPHSPPETECAPHSPQVQQMVLLIGDITHDHDEDEMNRIQSLAITRREAGRQALPRSNSTGHERPSGMERFALRLPEHVRLEILMSHRLRHVTSAVTSVSVREGSAHDDLGPGVVGGNVRRSAMARLLSLFVPGAGWKGDDEDMSGKGGGGSSRRRRDDSTRGGAGEDKRID